SWILPVATLPIAMLQVTYSRSFRQYRQRRQFERLYQATSAIRATIESTRVKEQLVRATHTIVDAGSVRLVDSATTPDPGALRARIDPNTSVEVTDRVRGGTWDDDDRFALEAVASVASTALSQASLYERLHTITGSLAEGVIALDPAGRIDFVNPAVAAILGWDPEAVIGRHPHAVLHAHERSGAAGCPLAAPLVVGRTSTRADDLFTCSDGTLLSVSYTTSPVLRDGASVGAVIAFHDVSERKTFERQLTHQAFHDALTGLPNRALFLDRIGHAQARAARSAARFAILFIDLDRFKLVNDSLGHHAGDELLVQVADRLRGCLRPGDTLARFGGDEFVALLEDLDDEAAAVSVTERLLADLAGPFTVAGRDLAVTASIGVVVGDGSGDNADETLREGDVAMYRAKARGKACYEVFRPDAEAGDRRRLDVEIELRGALERGELELHYQPVVDIVSGDIVGAEALLRWDHPERGFVPPGEFIPMAEETGLILELGAWVLDEACRQTRRWLDTHPHLGAFVTSINLSPRQFRQPDLADQVAAALTRAGLDPHHLCVEVTEGVMVDNVDAAILALHRLRRLGVSVSIDDFGTGYSSLSYLKSFPIDYVKIDRSFIRGLGHERVDSEIVTSVIRLAGAIGLRTVAEGVETDDQLERLRALGCSLAQGYLIARPAPAAHLDAALAEAGALSVP
ncbi:MAG: putative bifunctional diguanylate cyclase/phosphodiesterase, partial [Acidimicrobiia bacterium]